jgi:hypothetical protein
LFVFHFSSNTERGIGTLMSEGVQMRKLLVASALLAAFCVPALAGSQNGSNGGNGQNGSNGGNGQNVNGAPGPIAGAGLPILAVGYGAYWLLRRYRRKSDNVRS